MKNFQKMEEEVKFKFPHNIMNLKSTNGKCRNDLNDMRQAVCKWLY